MLLSRDEETNNFPYLYTWQPGAVCMVGYKQQFISFDDDDTRRREKEMPVHALWIIMTLSWLHYIQYNFVYLLHTLTHLLLIVARSLLANNNRRIFKFIGFIKLSSENAFVAASFCLRQWLLLLWHLPMLCSIMLLRDAINRLKLMSFLEVTIRRWN